MAQVGTPAASTPLDRYLDFSQLQRLTVSYGDSVTPLTGWTDLSWLAVIPTTRWTVCIDGAETRALRPLFEGRRRQTRLKQLWLESREPFSIVELNPLKYFPTPQVLELTLPHDIE